MHQNAKITSTSSISATKMHVYQGSRKRLKVVGAKKQIPSTCGATYKY